MADLNITFGSETKDFVDGISKAIRALKQLRNAAKQNKQGTENPYYGSMMFSCGEETRAIEVPGAQGEGGGETGDNLHQH